MDKMREIAGNGALMPRFDDGMANMTEPIRVMTESFVNKIMDTRGDEARELQPAQRLPRAQARHQRRHHRPQGPEAAPCSYFPEDLIERYSRVDRAVIAAVSEMAADGVSTRKVKRVAQGVGMGRTSASQVSRIRSSLDEAIADLQERDLPDVIHPYPGATWQRCIVHLTRNAAGNALTRQKRAPCRASRRPCSPSATPSS